MTHPMSHPPQPPLPQAGRDHSPGNPSPTAELTALAAQLSRLTTQLEDLDTRSTALSHTVTDRVLLELAQLRATTADQITQLQRLLDTTPAPSSGPPD